MDVIGTKCELAKPNFRAFANELGKQYKQSLETEIKEEKKKQFKMTILMSLIILPLNCII